MPEKAWRVAIVDSGMNAGPGMMAAAERRFRSEGDEVREAAASRDEHGHGTRIAQVIHGALRPPALLIAQALDARGTSTAAAIAAAVDWSVAQGAELVHLSVGLAQDRAVLARAIAAAMAAGVLIVASTPARGAKPFPAAYPGVIGATGDARCEPEQISALGAPYADFGGCVRLGTDGDARGASIGAAHVTRFIVSHASASADAAQVRAQLGALAAFHGREQR